MNDLDNVLLEMVVKMLPGCADVFSSTMVS